MRKTNTALIVTLLSTAPWAFAVRALGSTPDAIPETGETVDSPLASSPEAPSPESTSEVTRAAPTETANEAGAAETAAQGPSDGSTESAPPPPAEAPAEAATKAPAQSPAHAPVEASREGDVEAEVYTQDWTELAGNTEDAIIANVGGQILLMSDLQRAVTVLTRGRAELLPDGSIRGQGLTPSQVEGVFDELINQSLLEIKVKEFNLELTESELDDEIENFLESRQLRREDFLRMLEAEGETEETHRSEFRRRIETQRFIGRVIQPLVTVTDEEVRSFYVSEKPDATKGVEKLVLRSLMLSGTPEDPKTRDAIAAIAADRESGKSFEDIVKAHSQAPDASKNGGFIGERPIAALPPAVVDALGTAPDGTVAGPLTIGSSTFYFERISAAVSVDSTFEKEKDKWKARLQEQKFAERLQSYLEAERSKVRVEKRPLRFQIAGS